MSDQYAGPAKTAAAADSAAPVYRKPMPRIDAWNKAFWEGTRDKLFMAQQDEAGNVWFPPGPMSPFTHTANWKWVQLSGQGTVVSWVVFHQKYFAGFADDVPYNVALVQLAEGPVIFTNIAGISNDKMHIGMPVKVQFNEMDGTAKLPVFVPNEEGVQ